MAEQIQIDDQRIYAVIDKVVKDLLPLDRNSQLRVYRTIGTFFGFEELYPKVTGNVDSRVSANASREPQFSSSEEPTPKEFMLQKKPNTNIERVACLAYYLTHHRDTPEFNTIDINKLNTEAAQAKLSNPSNAVKHAVSAGYLAAATKKGMKQLSGPGEQYVEALPDRGAAKAVKLQTSRRSRRRIRTVRGENDQGQEQVKPNE